MILKKIKNKTIQNLKLFFFKINYYDKYYMYKSSAYQDYFETAGYPNRP